MIVTAGFLGMTAFLLWAGAVIAVRCERVASGRVDVVIERRVIGLVPVGRERFPDVVKAWSVQRRAPSRVGFSTVVGAQLALKLRDGREWESAPSAIQIVGTRPAEMADRIQEFIDRSTAPSLQLRWIPWLMSILVVPFLLISALIVAVWVNTARRALGGGGPA
jgi:hypothetical protein